MLSRSFVCRHCAARLATMKALSEHTNGAHPGQVVSWYAVRPA